MASEFAVAGGDRGTGSIGFGGQVGLGVGQRGQGVLDLVGGEGLGQPGVQGFDQRPLAHVGRQRMVEGVGQRVLVGVPAPVVSLVVVPAALHAPPARRAVDQALEHVAVPGTYHVPAGRTWSPRGHPRADLSEGVGADQRGVDRVVGEHPTALSGSRPAGSGGPERHPRRRSRILV